MNVSRASRWITTGPLLYLVLKQCFARIRGIEKIRSQTPDFLIFACQMRLAIYRNITHIYP